MGDLNLSANQIQILALGLAGLAALVVLIFAVRLLRRPMRRRSIRALAHRHQLVYQPRLAVNCGPTDYAINSRHPIPLSDHDPLEPPNKLRIEAIERTSVLHEPKFFNVFNTSQIRNYCYGAFQGVPVEVFDWQQSRRRNDRSARGPRSTLVALHVCDADLPWFVAFPAMGASRKTVTNSIAPPGYPPFNAAFQLQAPDGHPNSEQLILSLLNARALEMLVESGTVCVRAAGPHLVFSRGDVLLPPSKIEVLLTFAVSFSQALSQS